MKLFRAPSARSRSCPLPLPLSCPVSHFFGYHVSCLRHRVPTTESDLSRFTRHYNSHLRPYRRGRNWAGNHMVVGATECKRTDRQPDGDYPIVVVVVVMTKNSVGSLLRRAKLLKISSREQASVFYAPVFRTLRGGSVLQITMNNAIVYNETMVRPRDDVIGWL